MNSISHHKNYLSLCSQDAINIAATCSAQFYTVRYKEKCLGGRGRKALTEMVDNRINARFLGKQHSLEATCSILSFISRYPATRRHRTERYKTHSNRTPTAHELAHQRSKFKRCHQDPCNITKLIHRPEEALDIQSELIFVKARPTKFTVSTFLFCMRAVIIQISYQSNRYIFDDCSQQKTHWVTQSCLPAFRDSTRP